jgi:poly(3-hydroxybutyrate) depolymerase
VRAGNRDHGGCGPTLAQLLQRGREIQLPTIEGAGHQRPGSEQVRDSAEPPPQDLDATEVIWHVVAADPRP